MRDINILYVVLELFAGGLENGLVNLINNSSGKLNHVICCLRQKGVFEKRLKKHVKVYELDMKYGNDYTLPYKIYKIVKQEKIHILRAFNEEPFFYSFFPAKFTRVPIIYYNGGRTFPEKVRRVFIEKILGTFANSIVVPSKGLKEYMSNNVRIPKKKIRIIHNGVDIDRFNISLNVKKKKRSLQIPENDLIVGTIGRLTAQKDIPTFLKISKKLLSIRSDITFLIVGDGELKADLIKRAQPYSISGKVHFLGIRHDIDEIHNLIDIFLLTSRWEGMSNVILESMASSKTVIATNVEGVKQVINDGEHGFILEPGDVDGFVNRILTLHEKKRKKLGENAFKKIKTDFSISRMVEDYEKLYIEIINKHSTLH